MLSSGSLKANICQCHMLKPCNSQCLHINNRMPSPVPPLTPSINAVKVNVTQYVIPIGTNTTFPMIDTIYKYTCEQERKAQ